MNSNHPNNEVLLPGKEYPQPGEDKIVSDILTHLKDQMLRLYPPGEGIKQLRQIHPIMNGCVKAEFIIEPDLSDDLKVGLFKEPKSYPAWIRFSNGETKPVPDYKKDFRGFAIKLMNVPGKKLDMNHPDMTNHDFIMISRPTFFSGDLKQFAKIISVVTAPIKLKTIPRSLGILFSNVPTLLRAAKAKIKINHPAEIPYFSAVPYRFGDETKAIKYSVKPSAGNQLLYPEKPGKNFLRANLAATLKEHSLSYDFCVQFQMDSQKMPIENPSIEWTSPFIKLATIKIPKQIFDTPERNELGDNLAFNPWHCLAEHQPLGGFNRVRKFIYEEMYGFRHQNNNIPDTDPVAGPDFFNDTNID